MESFIPISNGSDFPLENLPYGIFSTAVDTTKRVGVALGDAVIDLAALQKKGLFSGPELSQRTLFTQETLNEFMGCGRAAWKEARSTLIRLFSSQEGQIRDDAALQQAVLIPKTEAQMHLPARVGDFTDFFACKAHASTVGSIFRGPERAISPNWPHMPVAYHARSSSIILSGTDIKLPKGQYLPPGTQQPVYDVSQKIDFELEMGLFVGPGNALGEPIDVNEAEEKHGFGLGLLNDWSLRDVQLWEGQPLGPFTSKNMATTISPWIVTMEALEPFKCPLSKQDGPILPYLSQTNPGTYDIQLEAILQPGVDAQPITITHSNMKEGYWSLSQLMAHHTCTGCNLLPGDVLGTGTLSANCPSGRGCLLERTCNGTDPVTWTAADGQSITRAFLQQGDAVTLKGWCVSDASRRIGFGPCTSRVV